jgi:hypothetical protein
MILYGLLFLSVFSLQAIFGPSKATIEKWDELLYSENSDRIKQYVQCHPDQLDYGLKRLKDLKENKENKFIGKEMGPEDWKRFMGGAVLAVIGGVIYCGVLTKSFDDESIFSSIDMKENIKPACIISVGAIALWESMRLGFKSVVQKTYSKKSIENLKTIQEELSELQKKATKCT